MLALVLLALSFAGLTTTFLRVLTVLAVTIVLVLLMLLMTGMFPPFVLVLLAVLVVLVLTTLAIFRGTGRGRRRRRSCLSRRFIHHQGQIGLDRCFGMA
jgi:hypothetical protein